MNPLRNWLMDWLRPGWRERAEAQDPIWSLAERTVVAVFGGITAWFGVKAATAFHFDLHPEDRLRFSDSTAQLPVVAFVGAPAVKMLGGQSSVEWWVAAARRSRNDLGHTGHTARCSSYAAFSSSGSAPRT